MFDHDNEHSAIVIRAGADFLAAMGQYYGSEKAIELWDSIRKNIGEDLAGAIFMSMLTGSSRRQVTVEYGGGSLKIEAIKQVRHVTGWGLQEAKDFVEATEFRPMKLDLLDKISLPSFVNEMKRAGYRVY